MPSDLYNLYKDGLGCIGSGLDNNIKCFIRKCIPEFKVYNDGDLLDALRLEFKGVDIDMELDEKEYKKK